MEISLRRNNPSFGIWFIILLIIVALLFIFGGVAPLVDADPSVINEIEHGISNVMIDEAYSHARTEHPDEYGLVRSCLENKGPYMTFLVSKNRYLRVCIIDELTGLVGFQIVDRVGKYVKERTAYIRRDICNIKQLLEYVKRQNYTRFKGPL